MLTQDTATKILVLKGRQMMLVTFGDVVQKYVQLLINNLQNLSHPMGANVTTSTNISILSNLRTMVTACFNELYKISQI